MPRTRKDPFLAGSGRTGLFLAGMAVTVLLLWVFALQPRLATDLDHKIYDTLLRAAPTPRPSGIAAIVDIDDKSLGRFGQWPWPRYRVAHLAEQLFHQGSAAVVFDMVFAEPDRTSLSRLALEMGRDLGVTVRLPDMPEAFLDNDRILAKALQRGRSVLGFALMFDKSGEDRPCSGKTPALPVLLPQGVSENQVPFFRASSAVCNIPVLAEAASSTGFFNIRPDSDGMLRRAPLVADQGGAIRPSLALSALMASGKAETVFVLTDAAGVDSLVFNKTEVPLDERGNLLVRFRGPSGSIPRYSAADVLHGDVPIGAFQDRILFIGSTAAGLKDTHATPFDQDFPGVEVHAHILENLASGGFLRRPQWIAGLEALLLAVLGVAVAAVFVWVGPLFGAGIACGGCLGLWIAASWCLRSFGIYLSPLFPMAGLASNFALLSLLKYYREEKKVQARTRELSLVQEVTIETVANVAETRDPETGGHIKRTQHYVRALSLQLRGRPKYKAVLDDVTIELLFRSAPLHDLGKVGVPDSILLKPASLTPEEFEKMKLHTTYAHNIISAAEQRLGKSSFLRIARELAYSHQEKWDGSGYPNGLKGEEIPLAGRLMAVADVYDALISRRPYKQPMPHEEAVKRITEGRGTHFDPEVVTAFLEIQDQFRRIAGRFADSNAQKPLFFPAAYPEKQKGRDE